VALHLSLLVPLVATRTQQGWKVRQVALLLLLVHP